MWDHAAWLFPYLLTICGKGNTTSFGGSSDGQTFHVIRHISKNLNSGDYSTANRARHNSRNFPDGVIKLVLKPS